MHRLWTFVEDGALPGAVNMRRDEETALLLLGGRGRPALRLYGWNPRAISLGYHQNEGDVDRSLCAAEGIDLVRRPTGGRAILHAEELTYAAVLEAEGSVTEVYLRIARALMRALRAAGADVELARPETGPTGPGRTPESAPCFSSAARHEILWRGRKIVGSAQRRYRDAGREVVLQHGSILTGPAHLRLPEFLRLSAEARTSLAGALRERTADLGEAAGKPVAPEVLAGHVRRGFEEEFGAVFAPPSSSTGTGRRHAPETTEAG